MLHKVDPRIWKIGFFIWAAVILLLTSFPNPQNLLPSPPGLDKLAHTAVYCILAFLMAAWLRRQASPRPWWLIFVFLATFGLLDELHQIPIPGRFFSWWDVVADLVGVALGITAVLGVSRRQSEKAHPQR
jgi:VanZ family protein